MRAAPGGQLLLLLLVLPGVCPGRLNAQEGRAKGDSLVQLAQREASADTGSGALGRAAILLSQAADWYGQAGARKEQSEVLSAVGGLHYRLGHWSLAAGFYRRAVAIDREIGDVAALSIDLNNLANSYLQTGRADTATTASFDTARRIFQEALEVRRSRGDSSAVGTVLWAIGILEHDRQAHDSERVFLTRAASAFVSSGDSGAAADVLAASAGLERGHGQYPAALEDLDAAARLSINTSRLATLQAEMGLVWAALGRFDHARVYATLAKRAAGDEDLDRTDFVGMARGLQAIGKLELALGRPDSARQNFARALDCTEVAWRYPSIVRAPDSISLGVVDLLRRCSREVTLGAPTAPPDPATVASVLYSLLRDVGDWYLEVGLADSALATYLRARELGDGSAEVLRGVGVANLRLGRAALAIEWLRKAQRQRADADDQVHVSAVLSDLADAYEQQGRPQTAQVLLDTALVIAREVRAPQALVTAYTGLARLHRWTSSLGGLSAAVAYYDSAAAVTRSLAGYTGDALTRMTFMERRASLYEEWALAWLARASDMPPGEAALAALAAAEAGRAEGLKRLVPGAVPVAAQEAPIPWQRGRWLDSVATAGGSSVLFYLVTSDTLVIWAGGSGGALTVFRVAIPRDSLRDLVVRVRRSLGPVDDWSACTSTGDAAPDYRELLRRLSQVLIPPGVLQVLGASGEVVISPHAFLATVPFAALDGGPDGRPFGVSHALRYTPSIEVLSRLRPAEPRAPDLKEALVVADPVMPVLHDVCGLPVFQPSRLGYIGRWSSRLAMQRGAVFLTDSAASEGAVRALLPRASIVHLGTHAHAYTEESRAIESWIALAPDVNGEPPASERQDGMLQVREIAEDLSLTADLVVLAACQTGLGDAKRSEGIVGLPWAFLARGARSVLASLWVVDERATVGLLDAFYRHWLDDGDHPTKAEALRRSQEDLWREGHPGSWASFQLTGGR